MYFFLNQMEWFLWLGTCWLKAFTQLVPVLFHDRRYEWHHIKQLLLQNTWRIVGRGQVMDPDKPSNSFLSYAFKIRYHISKHCLATTITNRIDRNWWRRELCGKSGHRVSTIYLLKRSVSAYFCSRVWGAKTAYEASYFPKKENSLSTRKVEIVEDSA